MGLTRIERRLERFVEGAFARAFRGTLQPVEIGRRLTREMDLQRTVAPRGTLCPNSFSVLVSEADFEKFSSIKDELVSELIGVAKDHASEEGYEFLGPVTLELNSDPSVDTGRLNIKAEIVRSTIKPTLVLSDGRTVALEKSPFIIGRAPESDLVIADPNVSRRHAELRSAPDSSNTEWDLSDLGSTNGTAINGMALIAPQRLRAGDKISFGTVIVNYQEES